MQYIDNDIPKHTRD